jgi:ATP-dependent helicase HrpA
MFLTVNPELSASALRRKARLASLAAIEFPADLPVVQKREDLARAIADNQVVIVCGETGSGKTTQLPKICLTLGRGVLGVIGHTQPRRVAARTVASRIAFELRPSWAARWVTRCVSMTKLGRTPASS